MQGITLHLWRLHIVKMFLLAKSGFQNFIVIYSNSELRIEISGGCRTNPTNYWARFYIQKKVLATHTHPLRSGVVKIKARENTVSLHVRCLYPMEIGLDRYNPTHGRWGPQRIVFTAVLSAGSQSVGNSVVFFSGQQCGDTERQNIQLAPYRRWV